MPGKDEKEPKKTVEEPVAVAAVKSSPPWPLITIGIFATVVTVALVIVSWTFIVSNTQNRAVTRLGGLGLAGQSGQAFQRGGFGHRGGAGGGMMQVAAARGVITPINGDTIIVGGQGKQVTVKKTSTTTITGDKTDIAVNDTVVVQGTTADDGTVTASTIMVRNVSGIQGSDMNTDSSSMNMAPGA